MIRIQLKKRQPLKVKKRLKNHARLRKRVSGTEERPRLSVFKSSRNIYAQLIDDVGRKTLLQASSLKLGKTCNQALARQVGEKIGQLAIKKNIKAVVFDRGGFIYHGKIKELAEGARSQGLKF